MRKKICRGSAFFILLIYGYTFRNILNNYIPLFKYADECLALVGLFLLNVSLIKKHKIYRSEFLIIIGLSLFIASGLTGSFLFRFQSIIKVVLPDLFLSIKFFFWMYLAIYICKNKVRSYNILFKRLSKHAGYLLFALFVITILDECFHVFNQYTDIKLGIRAVGLYEGPAALATTAASLICILVIGEKKLKWSKDIFFGLFIILSTLRFKSLAAVAVFSVLFFYGNMMKRYVKWRHFIILGLIAIFIAGKQIIVVISSGAARSMLYLTGLKIMRDYLPIGTGFGTFASHYSAVSYSPIYSMYSLSEIHGLTKTVPSFVSDAFWPMVFGQTGIIGMVGYCLVIFWIYNIFQANLKPNSGIYYGEIYTLLYLLIISTGESAFLHWNTVLLAVVLGIGVAYSFKLKEESNETGTKKEYHKKY